MRQSPRQTTDFILKAEKQKGVAYTELLANLYQHLLEKCLTAGAADMNRPNYCPVNSSTQVAGQFPSQAYLFVYIISDRVAECSLARRFYYNCYNQQFLISILPPRATKSARSISSSESVFYPHRSADQQISILPLPIIGANRA